jgi:hypothetical protein
MGNEYYTIESGIPVPDIDMTTAKTHYPWDKMSVGDSFLVKGEARDKYKTAISASGHRGKKYGEAYTARYVSGGLRVWRIK